jgi:hypothetical protein
VCACSVIVFCCLLTVSWQSRWPPSNRKTRKKTNQATKLNFWSNRHHSQKWPQYQENYYGQSISKKYCHHCWLLGTDILDYVNKIATGLVKC